MKVFKIPAFNIHPNFTSESKKSDFYKAPSLDYDRFELSSESSKNFDIKNEVHNYFNKLEKSMEIVTPHDVEKMAKSIQIKLGEGVKIKDIYETLEILTQYSSYKNLLPLKAELKKFGINQFSNFNCIYKNFKELDGTPIILTNLFHYISLRNFGFARDDFLEPTIIKKKALVLDTKLLDVLKSRSIAQRSYIYRKHIQDDNILPLYIKNFENGYNIFNQNNDLESLALTVLKKAIKSDNGKSVKENVERILNNDILEDLEKAGIRPFIYEFKPDAKYELMSFQERIADNLNPPIISKDNLQIFIDEMCQNDYEKPEELQKYYIDFLNKMMTVITPKQYANYLKEIHQKLLSHLKLKGKSLENTYFIIPSISKSFVVANYQYQKINNISPENILYYSGMSKCLKKDGILSRLPENSTIVVIDDCVISGASMLDEVFDYKDLSVSSALERKNIDVVIAPIVITKNGIGRIMQAAQLAGRLENDTIIAAKVLPEWNDNSHLLGKLYKNKIPANNKNLTSLIFPYMGPDTNCSRFIVFYEEFFVSPAAQKLTIDELDS